MTTATLNRRPSEPIRSGFLSTILAKLAEIYGFEGSTVSKRDTWHFYAA